jgi:acyl-coenzyme A thioesterase PaaI-like protein
LYVLDRGGPFEPGGTTVVPQPVGRGPWDHDALHGGAVCGLAGWAVEQVVAARAPAAELALARLTVELHAMVPARPLEVRTTVARPGRRAQVVDVELFHEGRRVARASSQWVARRPTAGGPGPLAELPPRPAEAVRPEIAPGVDLPRPGFNADAIELREVRGSTNAPGPGLSWARVAVDVVAGWPLSPLQRAAVLADVAHTVGWDEPPSGAAFINPDATLQLVREPVGEWVLVDAATRAGTSGVGWCEASLADEHGRFGAVLMSLVERPPMG